MSASFDDKNKMFIAVAYAFCIVQFILVLVITMVYPHFDKKLMLGLSAILGILISGNVRRIYKQHRFDESMKPLDDLLKDFKENKSDGNKN